MSKTQSIAIDLIRTNGGTQMRAELTTEVYMDYRDKWLAGVEFDPVDVFHDGSTYWLADGFHRFYGAREAKRGSIPCRVHQGTQRDAILFACGANSEHGLRRTGDDKRIAVRALLDDAEWGKRSTQWIAEQAAVSRTLVETIRRESETQGVEKHPAIKRTGKDGKAQSATQRKLRHKSSPRPAAIPQPQPPLPSEGTASQADQGSQGDGGAEGETPKQYNDPFNPAEWTPSEVKDSLGVKVSGELEEVFEITGEFDEQRNKLKAIKSWLTQRIKHPAGKWLESAVQRIRTDIDHADSEIKHAKPYCECVYCHNKAPKVANCNACKGLGWITEPIYDAAPKGMKREKVAS